MVQVLVVLTEVGILQCTSVVCVCVCVCVYVCMCACVCVCVCVSVYAHMHSRKQQDITQQVSDFVHMTPSIMATPFDDLQFVVSEE